MSDDPFLALKKNFDFAAIAQTEPRIVTPPPVATDANSPWVVGSSFLIGGAALWAAIAKLLEKYGNSALSNREQKSKQELDQARAISEFYLTQASKDAETNSKLLNTFVASHLNVTQQTIDSFTKASEKIESLERQISSQNEKISGLESLMRDMLSVMQMKDRQNKS